MDTTFGVGKVLGTGFRVWFRNLIPFLLLTAVCYSPPWIWAAITAHDAASTGAARPAVLALGIATISTVLLNIVASAALTYGVVMELQGNRASIGACITTGLTRFLPALAVAVLAWICVGFGSLLLVIPGFILLCRYYVVTQVAVLERRGVFGALGRSGELTRGHKLQIFGLYIILGVLSAVVNWAVSAALATPESNDLAAALNQLSRAVYVNFALQVVTGSASAVMASVAYYYLRAEKEGTSAAELAAIFD